MYVYITDKSGRSARLTLAGGVFNLSDSATRYEPSGWMSRSFNGWSAPPHCCRIRFALGREGPSDWFGEANDSAWPPVELKPDEVATSGRSNYVRLPGKPVGSERGDVTFGSDSLFLFDGKQDERASNVLLVLWRFPQYPTRNRNGPFQTGRLLKAGGMLSGGEVEWDIADH